MNILLTGGSGFIGKNIKNSFLSKEYNILAPSSNDLNLLDQKSVSNFFEKNKIDFIIHSACKPSHRNAKDLNKIFYSDMLMFLNLVNQHKYFKKMIVLSSGAIYDQRFDIKKVKEDDYKKRLPIDEHALFRWLAADYIKQSKKIIELRIFGIFGQFEDYSIRFISNLICKSIFDLPLSMNQNRKFDYIYVKDLIPIINFFLKNKVSSNCYNVTPNKSFELLTIAKKINKISGKNLKIEIKEKKIGYEYTGSNFKLKKEIKNIEFTPIDKAIKELYNWYLSNNKFLDKKYLKFNK